MPVIVKKMQPIVDHSVNHCLKVQLMAEGVELEPEVNVLQR
jgi:hypothetical protein